MNKPAQIYQAIENDIQRIEAVLKDKLRSRYDVLCSINNYLLSWGGKRLRPALVMLSAHAVSPNGIRKKDLDLLVLLAAAVELIHTASLIHDDIIDNSPLRRNKPTIHARWGNDVSIGFGDYIYSKAFELASRCGRPDVLDCIAQATSAMCEGQLLQILERDNLGLKKSEYMVIVKKKTAHLIAACCRAAALIISPRDKDKHKALDNYGLNFGIAFQIVDDYLDIMGDKDALGKVLGQDMAMGEITLPLYDLLDSLGRKEKGELKQIVLSRNINAEIIKDIRDKISHQKIFLKTKEKILSYVYRSKYNLSSLKDSLYRDKLMDLADYVVERGFGV